MSLVPALIFFVLGVATASIKEDDRLIVSGQLLCDGKPSPSVTVSLTDEDRVANGNFPLGLRATDESGKFTVDADVSLFKDFVDPTIEIVHKCRRRCIEKSRVRIPWEYALERGAREVVLSPIELSHEFPLAEETSFCSSESDITWTVNGDKQRG